MIKFWIPNKPYGCFSNFSLHSIIVNDKMYKTTEHFYQSKKTKDPVLQEQIRKCKTPKECKTLAYSLPLREDWESIKFKVMKYAVMCKVMQNPDVRFSLMQTGDEEIVENSPHDNVWGIGKDGKGSNLLGKILMEIREEIKNMDVNDEIKNTQIDDSFR